MKKSIKKVLSAVLTLIMVLGIAMPQVGAPVFADSSATVEITASKTLEGATLEDGQFTFAIEAITEGAPMPEKLEATNDAEGNISFGNASYTAAGTYEYKVTEVKGEDASIVYDSAPKTLVVTVEEKTVGGSEAGKTPDPNFETDLHWNDANLFGDTTIRFDPVVADENGNAVPEVQITITRDDGFVLYKFMTNGDGITLRFNKDQTYTLSGAKEGIIVQDLTFKGTGEVISPEPTGDGEDVVKFHGNEHGYWPSWHGNGEKGDYNHGDGSEGAYTDKTVTFGNTVEHVFCGARGVPSSESAGNTRTVFNAAGENASWDTIWTGGQQGSAAQYISNEDQANYPRWLDRIAFLYTYKFWKNNNNAKYTWTNEDNPGVLTGNDLYNAVRRIMYNAYPYNAANLSKNGLGNFTQQALWFTFQYGKAYRDAGYSIDDGGYASASGNAEAFKALIDFAINNKKTDGYNFHEGQGDVYVYWYVEYDKNGNGGITGNGMFAQPLVGMYATEPEAKLSTKCEETGKKELVAEVKTVEFINSKVTEEEKTPELNTTVTVDGESATKEKELEIKAASGEKVVTKTVVDKVDYKNLVKGNTYEVSGTLVEVEGGKVVKEVATAKEEKVADEENGTWDITFENVELEVGKTYVVFEKATPIKDIEGNEIPEEERKEIVHENPEDKAQTVVVAEEEPTEPEEPKEEEPEKPTEPEEPKENEPPTEEPEEPKENTPPPQVPSTGQKETPKNETPTTPQNPPQTPPQVPSTGNPPAAPNTGDTNNIMLWVLLGAAAAFVATLSLRIRIKR